MRHTCQQSSRKGNTEAETTKVYIIYMLQDTHQNAQLTMSSDFKLVSLDNTGYHCELFYKINNRFFKSPSVLFFSVTYFLPLAYFSVFVVSPFLGAFFFSLSYFFLTIVYFSFSLSLF